MCFYVVHGTHHSLAWQLILRSHQFAEFAPPLWKARYQFVEFAPPLLKVSYQFAEFAPPLLKVHYHLFHRHHQITLKHAK